MSPRSSSPVARAVRAVESFRTAADCIGPVAPGMSVFAITRGQFSMIDAVMHVLDCVGPARVSLWTWTVAEYEIDRFTALQRDGRKHGAELVTYADPRGRDPRGWFDCANLGAPFDDQRAADVRADLAAAGLWPIPVKARA